MDAIMWRGAERLLIVVASMMIEYLGYALFRDGKESYNTVDFESKVGKIVISGTGPGLVFMIFGATVLVSALIYGGATVTNNNNNQITQRLDVLEHSHRQNTEKIDIINQRIETEVKPLLIENNKQLKSISPVVAIKLEEKKK